MNFKRIGRIMVCLLLVCALIVNISPIKAHATGLVEGIAVAPLPVSVKVVAAAALICLGIMALSESNAFDNAVENFANFLTETTSYVVDGMVNVFGVVGSDGLVRSYLPQDLLEAGLSWAFDSGIVVYSSSFAPTSSAFTDETNDAIRLAANAPYAMLVDFGDSKPMVAMANSPLRYNLESGTTYIITTQDGSAISYFYRVMSINWLEERSGRKYCSYGTVVNFGSGNPGYYADGLALGNIQAPVEEVAFGDLEAYSAYAGGAISLPGVADDEEKLHLPVRIPGLEYNDDVITQTQEEAQTGVTDLEFEFSSESETETDSANWLQQIVNWFTQVYEGIVSLPGKIADAFKTLLQELFVPDAEFIPSKVEALKADYTFLDPMLSTGEDLKLFFQNIGSQPPIIWIDLGAGTGWHPMGGKVKFIDLTWYAQYKPTVDPIVGGFIWLWLAWRLFKAVPDLLAGGSGTVGAPTIAPDLTFNPARLPAGRSRKKKDGE